MMDYEMSGEPYSQNSGWINHLNEQIFQVTKTFRAIFFLCLFIRCRIIGSSHFHIGRGLQLYQNFKKYEIVGWAV